MTSQAAYLTEFDPCLSSETIPSSGAAGEPSPASGVFYALAELGGLDSRDTIQDGRLGLEALFADSCEHHSDCIALGILQSWAA